MAVGPKIQVRHDTTANWAAANPTLAAGEVGLDTTLGKFKVGDGSTAWTTLGFYKGVAAVSTGAPASPTSGDLWLDTDDVAVAGVAFLDSEGDPAAIGTVADGTSVYAARRDHVHAISGQLAFPATQNASAGANTLDDYEEGTWTPSITFGGGSTGVTYEANFRLGVYTKIGNLVTCTAICSLTSKGSSTGIVSMGGLPFTIGGSAGNYGVQHCNISPCSCTGYFWAQSAINTTTVSFYQSNTAGTRTELVDTNISNSSQFLLTFSYCV